MQREVRRFVLAGGLALTLSACPGFADEDPALGESLCNIDPESCLPDDPTGGTGLPAEYEPPPDPGEGREQEVEPPPGYEPQPDPGDAFDDTPIDPYG